MGKSNGKDIYRGGEKLRNVLGKVKIKYNLSSIKKAGNIGADILNERLLNKKSKKLEKLKSLRRIIDEMDF